MPCHGPCPSPHILTGLTPLFGAGRCCTTSSCKFSVWVLSCQQLNPCCGLASASWCWKPCLQPWSWEEPRLKKSNSWHGVRVMLPLPARAVVPFWSHEGYSAIMSCCAFAPLRADFLDFFGSDKCKAGPSNTWGYLTWSLKDVKSLCCEPTAALQWSSYVQLETCPHCVAAVAVPAPLRGWPCCNCRQWLPQKWIQPTCRSTWHCKITFTHEYNIDHLKNN